MHREECGKLEMSSALTILVKAIRNFLSEVVSSIM